MSYASAYDDPPRPAPPRSINPEALRFGRVVQAARKRAGLKQREVAEKVGVTTAAVAQWERGFALPMLETRLDLAQVLGIPYGQALPRMAERGPILVTEKDLIEIVRVLRQWPPEQRAALRLALTAGHSAA